MSEGIYQHYQPSERAFVDKCLDWIRQVNQSQVFHCTYFLNPREREILSNLTNADKLQFFAAPAVSAALKEAELQKVILAPDYYVLEPADFDLALLEILFPSKFGQISHRQILGTLLGETGLDRREIGDILVNAEKAQFYVSQRLVRHFIDNIHKIGRLAVKLKAVPLNAVITADDEPVTTVILVSSPRLDKIIAASLNISRNLALNMVQSGQIKVNYSEIVKSDHQLVEDDLISVRGYGRIKLLRQLGFTKKDKLKIEISMILSRKGR